MPMPRAVPAASNGRNPIGVASTGGQSAGSDGPPVGRRRIGGAPKWTAATIASASAAAAIWADLLSRDLTSEFRLRRRPVDDPLLYQLADPRRARPQLTDGLWVRIIDVPGALTGRRYAVPVDVVLEVRDDLLPSNAGRWRLTVGGDGVATCVPVAAGSAVDVALDVTELGAAYLGGTKLGALAAAGLVTELLPGALGPLSAAMGWDPAPWCSLVF